MRDWIQEAWSVLGGDRSVGDPRRLIGRATAVMIRIHELEAEVAQLRPEPLHPEHSEPKSCPLCHGAFKIFDEMDLSMMPCPKCEPLHPDIAKGIPPLDIGEAFKNRRKL